MALREWKSPKRLISCLGSKLINMKSRRKQLTIFLEDKDANSIEAIRSRFNPKQYELIKSHITLCREDEIDNLEAVIHNLENTESRKFELYLGDLKRFSEGKGVMIPIQDRDQLFQELRSTILRNVIDIPRKHQPHITLMHPRNSTCTDNLFEDIKKIALPKKIMVSKINLIEQEIGKKWRVLKVYELDIASSE